MNSSDYQILKKKKAITKKTKSKFLRTAIFPSHFPMRLIVN